MTTKKSFINRDQFIQLGILILMILGLIQGCKFFKIDGKKDLIEEVDGAMKLIDGSEELTDQHLDRICELVSDKNLDEDQRGKILRQILLSKFDNNTFSKIFNRCDFSNSYLKWQEKDYYSYFYSKNYAKNIYMRNIKIGESNIEDAYFPKGNFENADLNGADISNATFLKSSFYKANLEKCNVESTDFTEVDFRKSNLDKVNLNNTILIHSDFSNTDLREIKGNFDNSILWGIELENAKVESKRWIDNISKAAIGKEYIQENYFVEESTRKDEKGKYYLLKKGENSSLNTAITNVLNNDKLEFNGINFINQRIKFKIDYPVEIFKKCFDSENGDGLTLLSDNEEFVMRIYGTNFNSYDMDEVLDELVINSLTDFRRSFNKKGSGYISGYTNEKRDTIFYSIVLRDNSSESDFEFLIFDVEYPTTYKVQFEPVLEKIAKSFTNKPIEKS